uniref:Uncharacterized protein n=1 Tax=Pristionchus pacificus TaxID=54126 RepID=A0A2A6CH37_PRIPA|eukprot:PDM77388.1 hypothetical protein PRIPAC_33118 [Pristionchus pacificus]
MTGETMDDTKYASASIWIRRSTSDERLLTAATWYRGRAPECRERPSHAEREHREGRGEGSVEAEEAL